MSVDTVSDSSSPAIPIPIPVPVSPSPHFDASGHAAAVIPPAMALPVEAGASISPFYNAPLANAPRHIRLTSHAGGFGALPIHWGAATAAERGPVVGTTTKRAHRNVIGTHSGSYSVYRALAVAAGALKREHKADLTNTVADRRHRPLSAVERAGPDRLARPVGRAGGRCLLRPSWPPATTSARPSPSPRRT